MAMQAILSEDLDTFNKRLELIHQINPIEMSDQIKELRKKRKEMFRKIKEELGIKGATWSNEQDKQIQRMLEEKLSKEEQIKLSIPAFVDGVHSYQSSQLYELMDSSGILTHTQQILDKASVVLSRELEKAGGIKNAGHFTGIYKEEELGQYFKSFENLFSSSSINQPAVFILSSSSHAVTVAYHPKVRKWIFIDANHLPAAYFSEVEEIAKAVMKAMGNISDKTALLTQIFTTGSASEQLTEIVHHWQKTEEWTSIHKISSDKAKWSNAEHASWLNIAVTDNDSETVEALLKQGAKVNQAAYKGYTPLHTAASMGNIEIVEKLLVEKEIAVNLTNHNGETPFFLALKSRNNEIVAEKLMEKGVDINKPDNNEITPLMMIASQGRVDIAEKLIEKGADINYANIEGATPLFIAAQYGHLDMVKCLLKHSANASLSLKKKPRDLMKFALEINNDAVIKRMNEFIEKKTGLSSTLIFLSEDNIRMTPKEIAHVMGHEDIIHLINVNLSQSNEELKKPEI
ncbi:ankyrin repeat domain-containing protein [Legionella israelensis]|nr:ankyrin repeat domain-containing protein [Legionella israelensis]